MVYNGTNMVYDGTNMVYDGTNMVYDGTNMVYAWYDFDVNIVYSIISIKHTIFT